jgi:hypothetical protein
MSRRVLPSTECGIIKKLDYSEWLLDLKILIEEIGGPTGLLDAL